MHVNGLGNHGAGYLNSFQSAGETLSKDILFLSAQKASVVFSAGESNPIEIFKNFNAQISSYAGSIPKLDDRKTRIWIPLCSEIFSEPGQFSDGAGQEMPVRSHLYQYPGSSALLENAFQWLHGNSRHLNQFPGARRNLAVLFQDGLNFFHELFFFHTQACLMIR